MSATALLISMLVLFPVRPVLKLVSGTFPAGVTVSLAQTTESGVQPQQKKSEQADQNPDPSVASTDPVLTIHGACPPSGNASAAGADSCTTVVTRQEFDELLRVLAPGPKISAVMRQNVAQTYAELLAFEMSARKAGIADSAEFQEKMRLLRLRTLADSYRRSLEKEYGTASAQEIDEYYRRESSRFEEVQLRRIVLPRNNFAAADKEEFEKKARQVAAGLRERAMAGEDMDQLQREAYTSLGFSGPPPATAIGSFRRAGLLAEVREDVFGLKPGQVSKVEKETYSIVIYKVEAKRLLPKEMVTEEISRDLSRQKLENVLKTVTGAVHSDLNEKYFRTSEPQKKVDAAGGSPSQSK